MRLLPVLSTLLLSATSLVAVNALSGCSGTAQAEANTADPAKAASAKAASAKAARPAPKTYARANVAVAVDATVPDLLVVTGSVQPFDRSDLVPDVSGKVIEVLVDRGSVVAQGDPLVRLDTRSAALSEREARANLGSLRSQQRLADDTCRRSKELLDKGAITLSEYERDQTACTQARSSVAAASARLAIADKAQADGLIRAPFAGTIAERWVSLGEWASPQGKLFTLVDDHALRADLSLSEAAAIHAKLGAEVVIMPVADRSREVRGTISRLGVEIDPKTRALLVEVALPQDKTSPLRAGMFVEARLAMGERTLPTVPKSAITKRGSTWRLFVVVGDRLEERVVQLGPDAGANATIVRGLTVGESFASVVDDATTDGAIIQ